MEMNNDIFTPDLPIPEPVSFEDAPIPTPVEEETPAAAPPPRRRRKADAPVLTIESGDEIETEDAREAAAWHEIHNAYRTRRILSAPLGGIEQTDSDKTIAVVDYNGFRIVIPLKEMMVMPGMWCAPASGMSAAVCGAATTMFTSIRKRPRPAPAAALNPCRLCWNPLHRILLYWEIPCN